jgi:hypothetical protein
MNTIKSNRLLWLLALSSLMLFLIQPFFTWFTADDFCFMPEVQSQGIFQNMWHHYMNWDGRGMSITFIVARLGLWSGVYWVGPMLASVLFMLFGGLVLRVFMPRLENHKERIISLSVMTAVLWLCAFPFSSQTLYWSTGAGYNLDIILILAGYALFIYYRPALPFVLGTLPVLFYVGTASPNAVAGLLFLFATHAVTEWNQLRKQWLKYLWLLMPIIAGFLMVILAPGNANRLVGMAKSNLTHIWTIYFNAGHILENLMEYNTPVTWMLLLAGMLGAWAGMTEKKGLKQHLFAHRFLFAAIISVYFFMAMPGAHAPRTNIHFMAFMTMYGISGLAALMEAFSTLALRFTRPLQYTVLFCFLGIGLYQTWDARNARRLVLQRDAKLRKLHGQVVVLGKADDIKEPTTRKFEDLGSDPNYWLNRCVADYYGLKSIVMDKKQK